MNSEATKAAGTILLVEDNGINKLYIETVLAEAGYRVLGAGNGKEALERLDSVVPDLILMDIQMPVMDGLECARRIRSSADPSRSSIPIVALTGYAMEDDKKRCLEAGMRSFLSKPFEDEQIISVVKAELRKRGE
jgi:CheY-like chemotaxis protein